MPQGRLALGGLVFVLLFAAYFSVLRGHIVASSHDPDDWRPAAAVAALATVFSNFALLAVASALQAAADRRRLGTFLDGAPYRDGAFAAVEGEAQAAGKLLTAPFSGRPCLAYEYDVWMGSGSIPGRQRSGQGRGWAGLAGVALAPTAIEGASGPVRLLGWTPLETHFRPEWFESKDPDVHKKLKALIRERSFEKRTGAKALGLIGRLLDLQSDEDGSLRQDWCLDEDALEAPEDVVISERVIQEGDRVSASGLWSAERGGLYGDVGKGVGLELWPGHLDDRRRLLLAAPLARLAFMLLLCAFVHGVVFMVWKSSDDVAVLRAEHKRAQTREVFQKVLWQDLDATREAIRAGADIELRDHYGDTILMTAARERDPKWVKMLIEEGADIRAENPKWGSALTQAITTGKTEAIALLKAAGAQDFRVTADNGRSLPPDGGDVLALIQRWYGAIEKSDLETVKAVHWNPIDSSIDWDLWRQVRPLRMETIGGYASDTAATVTVTGRDPAGRPRTWSYHLIRKGGDDPWRILHEWDED